MNILTNVNTTLYPKKSLYNTCVARTHLFSFNLVQFPRYNAHRRLSILVSRTLVAKKTMLLCLSNPSFSKRGMHRTGAGIPSYIYAKKYNFYNTPNIGKRSASYFQGDIVRAPFTKKTLLFSLNPQGHPFVFIRSCHNTDCLTKNCKDPQQSGQILNHLPPNTTHESENVYIIGHLTHKAPTTVKFIPLDSLTRKQDLVLYDKKYTIQDVLIDISHKENLSELEKFNVKEAIISSLKETKKPSISKTMFHFKKREHKHFIKYNNKSKYIFKLKARSLNQSTNKNLEPIEILD